MSGCEWINVEGSRRLMACAREARQLVRITGTADAYEARLCPKHAARAVAQTAMSCEIHLVPLGGSD